MLTNTGNPNFQAPEMVQNFKYDEKIDIWGVGCCLFYMITKK